jgi:penicillin-binding protein 2
LKRVETSVLVAGPCGKLRSHAGHAGQHRARWPSTSSCKGLIERPVSAPAVARLVAIDPRNGEVLAFVSKPTFDPNLFVDGIDCRELEGAQRSH